MADIIPSSEDIQKIIEILYIIKNKIDVKTDVVWTKYETVQELEKNIINSIEGLQSGNSYVLGELYLLFLPTGDFQELSISNGWGDEFLKLAEQFDIHYGKIKSL